MKKIGYIIIPVILIIVVFTFLGNDESEAQYVERIKKERVEKDEFMKTSNASPFKEDPDSFTGLNYFEPNPKFKVSADITKFTTKEYVNIPESDGSSKQYLKFAKASFKLNNMPYELLLLKQTGFGSMNVIFTAFTDNTSGNTTYGGGRYLDLSFKNASKITIDFNQAYNPYCEYNESFSCPLPPRENHISMAIEAGEKNYKD